MPKPKYEPWDQEKTRQLYMLRYARHLESPAAFAKAMQDAGLNLSDQAYMRRERGETPVLVDEIPGIAKVLGLSWEDTLALYLRPETLAAFPRPKNDTQHSEVLNDHLT